MAKTDSSRNGLPRAYDPWSYWFYGLLFSLLPVFFMSYSNSKIFPNGTMLRRKMRTFFIVYILLIVAFFLVQTLAVKMAISDVLFIAKTDPYQALAFLMKPYDDLPALTRFAKNVLRNAGTLLFIANIFLLILVLRFTRKHELPMYKQLQANHQVRSKNSAAPLAIGIAISLLLYFAPTYYPLWLVKAFAGHPSVPSASSDSHSISFVVAQENPLPIPSLQQRLGYPSTYQIVVNPYTRDYHSRFDFELKEYWKRVPPQLIYVAIYDEPSVRANDKKEQERCAMLQNSGHECPPPSLTLTTPFETFQEEKRAYEANPPLSEIPLAGYSYRAIHGTRYLAHPSSIDGYPFLEYIQFINGQRVKIEVGYDGTPAQEKQSDALVGELRFTPIR